MRMTGSQILAKTLKTAGVKHVFGLVGHGNIAMIDGLVREGIQFISCHHETIAGMAADGYFRATHKPGVACLTCAPGALNAQLATATAVQDHSAVIYLTGDIPFRFAGKGTYEEVDLNGPDDQFRLLQPGFKRAWKITNLDLLSQFAANAYSAAMQGCPGPVLLNFPFDLQTQEVDTPLADIPSRLPTDKPQGSDRGVREAAALLQKAKRPVLFIGGGVILSGATQEVTELSRLLSAPIITSIMGSGAVSGEDPYVAGFVGSYGVETANELARKADVLLAVGTRFEEEETAIWLDGEIFRIPPTRLIQIDIEAKEIGKNYPVEVGIVGDARNTLAKLIQVLKRDRKNRERKSGRISSLKREKAKWLSQFEPVITSTATPIEPRRILTALSRLLPPDGVLSVDPSWARIGLLQQLGMPGKDRLFIVGGVLPIGWSTAASLGIAMGRPGRPVVAIAGDGGFLLNIQSVLTAVEYDLPIIWVVINNQGYNALDVLQKAYFGKTVGSRFEKALSGEPVPPDFVGLAKALHARGERIEDPKDIESALKRGFAARGPYVIDFISSSTGSKLVRTAPVTWSYFWAARRSKGFKVDSKA
jgi:acetolactate synthase I/II/III large subunit